jgi:diketogulonate reductase-like aldo/keto reductase
MHMQQGTAKAQLACEELLQRLRVQYVDLLLIHWPGVAKIEVIQLCSDMHPNMHPSLPGPSHAGTAQNLVRCCAEKGTRTVCIRRWRKNNTL